VNVLCLHCGAPRQTSAPNCPYCRTLYATPAPPGAPSPLLEGPPGVAEALADGNLIEAIRLYRKATGASLKEAKTAVEKVRAAKS
jgi:hypothetical protein